MSKYNYEFSIPFRKAFKVLKKKPEIKKKLYSKIDQILENPHHYKPLRNVFKNRFRAHIGSYVLIFEVNEEEKVVTFHRFQHHDGAYKKP